MNIVIEKKKINHLTKIGIERFNDFMIEYNNIYNSMLMQVFKYIQFDTKGLQFITHKRFLKTILILHFSPISQENKNQLLQELMLFANEPNTTVLHRKLLIILLKIRTFLVRSSISEKDKEELESIEKSIYNIWDFKAYYKYTAILFCEFFKASEQMLQSILSFIDNTESLRQIIVFMNNNIIILIFNKKMPKAEFVMRFLLKYSQIEFTDFVSHINQSTQTHINKLILYKDLLEHNTYHNVIFTFWD